MIIRNELDLRLAYELLTDKEFPLKPIKQISIKREIRHYLNMKNNVRFPSTLVMDYGIDGYVEKVFLCYACDGNYDDAMRLFDEYIYIPIYPSQYDCTGRPFTSWHKIVKLHDCYYAYHFVAFDV